MPSVTKYFANLAPEKRAGLEKLRRALKALLPKAEECISYGVPAFRHPDGVVVYYAAMKTHLSLFPTSYPIEACAEDLKGYATSRGTIRFPVAAPLPAPLLKKLIKIRLEQMAAKRARQTAPKARIRPSVPSRKPNAAWHAKHRMPKNARLPERAAWHLAHQANCRCREIPASVAAYLAGRRKPE